MREPVAKRRPLIDVEEFERRLRQPSAAHRDGDDPLAELARLHGGHEDPYKTVFEPISHPLAETWDGGAPAPFRRQDHLDPHEGQFGDDFAAIEAGLLGARRQDQAFHLVEPDEPENFALQDLESSYWPHESEMESPHPSEPGDDDIRSKRPLYLMAGIIAVGIIGIGASFAFKGNSSSPREIATIRAADGPVKIQPEATASADAPSQDASILNKSPLPTPVALIDNAEQPVDLAQAAEATARAGSGGGAASVPVPPPPAAAQPRAQGQHEPLSIAALIEPKKVKTVSVRPDGTVLPSDRQPPNAAQTQAGAHPGGDANKTAAPKTTARVATTPKLPAAAGGDASQSSPNSSAARGRPVQVADARSAAPAAPAQANVGAFAVQLAAAGSEHEARDIQIRLMKKLGNELSGHHTAIHKAALGAKTVYRIRVPNLSQDEANSLCQKIKGGGGACIVAKN